MYFWINVYFAPQAFCESRGFYYGESTGKTRWGGGIRLVQQQQVLCYTHPI